MCNTGVSWTPLAEGKVHHFEVRGLYNGETLRPDGGLTYRGGRLRSASAEALDILRPMQLFTRWYGFALTFHDTEIYAASGP